KATYLRDEAAGRRFWPAKVGTIDIEALRHERDQLLAEAAQALRKGEQWWPDAEFEREYIIPQQELRYEPDVWEQRVASYLADQCETTVSDIAQHALLIETPRCSTTDPN